MSEVTVTISLPESMKKEAEELIRKGYFLDISDVVNENLKIARFLTCNAGTFLRPPLAKGGWGGI